MSSGGEGEVDGAKFGVLGRNRATSTHVGRMLVVVDRTTGQRCAFPLPNRDAPAGRNPGPESLAEVDPILAASFAEDSIQISDSAHAYSQSAQRGNRLAAAVNHTQKQFSRLDRVPRASLTPRQEAMAASRSSSSSKTLRCTVSTNAAEGFIGNTKQVMAKQGLLGSGASRKAALNALVGVFMLKTPGLEALGKAMSSFLRARVDKVSPDTCFEDAALNLP